MEYRNFKDLIQRRVFTIFAPFFNKVKNFKITTNTSCVSGGNKRLNTWKPDSLTPERRFSELLEYCENPRNTQIFRSRFRSRFRFLIKKSVLLKSAFLLTFLIEPSLMIGLSKCETSHIVLVVRLGFRFLFHHIMCLCLLPAHFYASVVWNRMRWKWIYSWTINEGLPARIFWKLLTRDRSSVL